jgi:ABC-type phosphate transport system substrate-binding protein
MNLESSRSLVAAALFVVGLTLTACGDQKAPDSGAPAKPGDTAAASTAKSTAPTAGGSAKVASCNAIKTESLCREYGDKNISAAGEDHIKKICEGMGEFKMEACPKDKRVGSCATPEGTKVFYSDGGFPQDAAKAEKSCKEGVPAGEWTKG